MRVSVLHWNRPDECLRTLAVLRASGLPLEITVVDNGSTPANRDEVARGLPSDVEWIALPQNIGWGPAHNVVLRRWLERETSKYCIVSAHDALPQNDCLVRLVRALDSRPDWGMACPEYGRPERPTYTVLRGARLLPVSRRATDALEEVEYCHGTLAVFRRDCLRDIGVFDEGFFAYGDETEIGLRARAKGWKVGLVWGAILVNPGSWSGSAVIAYLWTRSTLRLARRFGGLTGLAGRTMVVLAATLREWVKRAPNHELSSPAARLHGIRDYFRGYTGAPPPEVISLREGGRRNAVFKA